MRPIALTAVLALAAVLSLPVRAAEDLTFSVLRTTQGDEITFQALPAAEVSARLRELQDKAKKDHASWEADRDAFQQNKANARKKFRDPEPAPLSLKIVKTGFATKEEAENDAEERQRKSDGKYAVVKVTTIDGSVDHEIILQRKIKGKEKELEEEYEAALEKWDSGKTAWYNNSANLDDPSTPGTNESKPYTARKPTKPKLERLQEGLADEDAAKKALDALLKGP